MPQPNTFWPNQFWPNQSSSAGGPKRIVALTIEVNKISAEVIEVEKAHVAFIQIDKSLTGMNVRMGKKLK